MKLDVFWGFFTRKQCVKGGVATASLSVVTNQMLPLCDVTCSVASQLTWKVMVVLNKVPGTIASGNAKKTRRAAQSRVELRGGKAPLEGEGERSRVIP